MRYANFGEVQYLLTSQVSEIRRLLGIESANWFFSIRMTHKGKPKLLVSIEPENKHRFPKVITLEHQGQKLKVPVEVIYTMDNMKAGMLLATQTGRTMKEEAPVTGLSNYELNKG